MDFIHADHTEPIVVLKCDESGVFALSSTRLTRNSANGVEVINFPPGAISMVAPFPSVRYISYANHTDRFIDGRRDGPAVPGTRCTIVNDHLATADGRTLRLFHRLDLPEAVVIVDADITRLDAYRSQVIIGTTAGTVSIYDIIGRTLHSLPYQHAAGITGLAYCAYNNMVSVISSSFDGTVVEHHLRRGTHSVVATFAGPVTAMSWAVRSTGHDLAVVVDDHNAFIVQRRVGVPDQTTELGECIGPIALNNDGRVVLVRRTNRVELVTVSALPTMAAAPPAPSAPAEAASAAMMNAYLASVTLRQPTAPAAPPPPSARRQLAAPPPSARRQLATALAEAAECPICANILRDAVVMRCCGKTLCRGCLTPASCPFCRGASPKTDNMSAELAAILAMIAALPE